MLLSSSNSPMSSSKIWERPQLDSMSTISPVIRDPSNTASKSSSMFDLIQNIYILLPIQSVHASSIKIYKSKFGSYSCLSIYINDKLFIIIFDIISFARYHFNKELIIRKGFKIISSMINGNLFIYCIKGL